MDTVTSPSTGTVGSKDARIVQTAENGLVGNGRLARPAAQLSSATRNQIFAPRPLLYAALAFASGLWADKYILVSAKLVGKCRPRVRMLRSLFAAPKNAGCFSLALGAVFAAVALTIQVRESYSQRVPSLGNDEVVVTAHVIAEGEVTAGRPGVLAPKN